MGDLLGDVGDWVGELEQSISSNVQRFPLYATAVCFVPALLMTIPFQLFVDPTDVS